MVGTAPRALAVRANGEVWITNKSSASISVVDSASLSVTRTIALPFASQPFGIVADPALGGQGWIDYTAVVAKAGEYSMSGQVITQLWAVGVTLLWSGIGSAILYFIIDKTLGLRPSEEAEREGLDLSSHGERAYNY